MPKAAGKRRSGNPLERARESGLDSLFTVHPKGFVAARNAVADALKKSGDAEAAGAVRSLSRPTVPVWVVNQVARRKATEVAELLEVSAGLRRAQQGKAGDLRTLSERHRELVKVLRAEAARVLEVAPTSTTTNLDRAEHTLLAAAAGTDAQREQLSAGELREELVAAGFDVFGGFGGAFAAPPAVPAAAEPSAPKAAASKTDGKRSAAEARKDAQSAARERLAAEKRAQQAAKEAEAAEREAAAREAADAAERVAAALTAAVAKAEAEHASATEVYQAARAKLDEAEATLKTARSELTRAQARAEQLQKKAKQAAR